MSVLKLKVVKTRGLDILRQMHFEEMLFKRGTESYCFLNSHSPGFAAILGSESQGDACKKLLNLGKIAEGSKVRVLRRYSTGATVLVDENTSFVSFISNGCDHSEQMPSVNPREVMQWSERLFKPVFAERGLDLAVMENSDFVIPSADGSTMKIGASTQRINGDRFVQHSCFAWDCDLAAMCQYVAHPIQEPEYRQNRSHEQFVAVLRQHFADDFDLFEDRIFARIAEYFSDWEIEVLSGEEMEALYEQMLEQLDADIIAGKVRGNRMALITAEDISEEAMATHYGIQRAGL